MNIYETHFQTIVEFKTFEVFVNDDILYELLFDLMDSLKFYDKFISVMLWLV